MRSVAEITRYCRARWLRVLALAPVIALVFSACSSHDSLSFQVKSALNRDDYDTALERVEKISKSTSHLLYLYEKGLVLHYQKHYAESSEAFSEAELVYEDLYTKSVSRELTALLTSDTVTRYRGERFEAALTHYYQIFNYFGMGDVDGAVVESRKLNELLQLFADSEDGKAANDPFLQYLTGMVYLAGGEYNDAGVSFRTAAAAYRELGEEFNVTMPRFLYCDLAASAEAVSDFSTAASYRDSTTCDCGGGEEDIGIVNLFLECGYVPFKTQISAVIPIYKNEVSDDLDRDAFAHTLYDRYDQPRSRHRKLDFVLHIAVPRLTSGGASNADVDVRVVTGTDAQRVPTVVVENLEAQASRAFQADKPGMILKTIARSLSKYLAKKGVEKKKGKVAGWIANALLAATERADTRSWTTLPRSIRMSRLCLPAGMYDIEITSHDSEAGRDRSFLIRGVTVTAGGTIFLNHRVY